MARSEAPNAMGSSWAKNTWRPIWKGVTVKSAANIQSRITTVAGTVSTDMITMARCSAGAKARLPPASSARRNATGAPGEMAIRMDAHRDRPRQSEQLQRQHGERRHRHDDREDTAISTTRRCNAASICSRPSISPIANMTANTASVANSPIHWNGTINA